MLFTGTIHFSNDLSEDRWNDLVRRFGLEGTQEVDMFAPVIGEYLTVKDPPNLLALLRSKAGDRPGIIRCSRMFFGGGVGDTAEISFQGEGQTFERLVRDIADFLQGEISVNDSLK